MFLLFLALTFSKVTLDSKQLLEYRPVKFEEWVSLLQIYIDEINTSNIVIENAEIYYIKHTKINQIKISVIDSTYTPGKNPKLKIDLIKIDSLYIETEVKMRYGLVDIGCKKGPISVTIKDLELSLDMNFEPNEKHGYNLIDKVNCDLTVTKIGELGGDFKSFGTIGNILPGLINMFKNTIKNTISGDKVDKALSDALTNLFQSVNTMMMPYINGSAIEERNKKIPHVNEKIMYDLRKSPLIAAVKYLLNTLIGVDGPLNLNILFDKLSTGKPGFISLTQFFEKDFMKSLLGDKVKMPILIPIALDSISNGTYINLTLNEASLSGLNTWGDFSFFEFENGYLSNTHTSLKNLSINLDFRVDVVVKGELINTSNEEVYLTEGGEIVIDLERNNLELKLQLASPKGAGLNYTDKMSLNLDCLLGLLSSDGTYISHLNLTTFVNTLALKMSEDIETGSVDEGINLLINNFATLFVDNFKDIIPVFLNAIVDTNIIDLLNNLLLGALNNSNCSYIEDDPFVQISSTGTAVPFTFAVIFALLLAIPIFLFGVIKAKSDKLSAEEDEDDNEDNKESTGFFRTDEKASLLMTKQLPIPVRILVPFLVFCNIALFISSNTGNGASVFIKLVVGKKKVGFGSMKDFGLINSVVEMFSNGAPLLGVLIIVMSCLWPYTKLILMLIVWVLPTSILSEKRRKGILNVLDTLGKWSLLDSFVMILMIVAFYFEIAIPPPDGTFTADLWVYPAYGFVTLLIGTLFSLANSHIMLFIIERLEKRPPPVQVGPTVSLFSKCLTQNKLMAILILIALIVVFIFDVLGMLLKSFSFDFNGLLGWAMLLLGIRNYNEYSVLDIGVDVTDCAEYPNSFGVRLTQVLYFIVTIVTPILHVLVLLITWMIPFSIKIQKSLYKLAHSIFAWSCLDVFIVSIIAAVMEISTFAASMIPPDISSNINPIVSEFFTHEYLIDANDPSVFGVKTRLLSAAYLLLVAAIFHDASTIIINRFLDKILEKDENQTENSSKSKIQKEMVEDVATEQQQDYPVEIQQQEENL